MFCVLYCLMSCCLKVLFTNTEFIITSQSTVLLLWSGVSHCVDLSMRVEIISLELDSKFDMLQTIYNSLI